jgi:glutathione S-transferase
MKLYYSPGACSLADHIALAESGMAYTLAKVDLKTKTIEGGGDYNAINPKGYVPALALDDGEILTENIAILSYIAATSGRLSPATGMAHWRVLETTVYISTELHKNFKPFFNPASTDADRAKGREMLTKRFGLLEQNLGGRDFIVGGEMSIADCYLFVMLRWTHGEMVGLTIPPGLRGYYDRLKQRPGIQRALKEEGLG